MTLRELFGQDDRGCSSGHWYGHVFDDEDHDRPVSLWYFPDQDIWIQDKRNTKLTALHKKSTYAHTKRKKERRA